MLTVRYVQLNHPEWGTYLDPEPYLAVLEELLPRLPAGAAAFAADPEHYNFNAPHCVKDLKLTQLDYRDDGSELTVTADFRFNNLGVADELSVTYRAVTALSIETADRNPLGPTRLGDLMLDEILPAEDGVTHELAFHGGRMQVACNDLDAAWSPPGPAAEEPPSPAR